MNRERPELTAPDRGGRGRVGVEPGGAALDGTPGRVDRCVLLPVLAWQLPPTWGMPVDYFDVDFEKQAATTCGARSRRP
ncbi:hypothetical protein [Streptomyces mirabilis]|uniref:hypothetical protein n=1 Tax=Streptomyces mirabilis TaxID=68239 RepID=UPI00225B1A36|nr:hypothetical protein [Streptomyces mirabilis]MCX4426442.1 hypothetical protein [Streptomyces mirabilis]